MELINQVCNLELSKKLKELGVKQESLFYWCNLHQTYGTLETKEVEWHLNFGTQGWANTSLVSAFTVAELGEMLPKGKNWIVHYFTKLNVSFCEDSGQFTDKYVEASTEANARAKMLIYLIQNKLIKI